MHQNNNFGGRVQPGPIVTHWGSLCFASVPYQQCAYLYGPTGQRGEEAYFLGAEGRE